MDYIKLYVDMLYDHFDELTDAEVGEIVRCALRYVRDGEEPEFERRSVLGLTWKRFKAHIDQSAAKAETLRANGSRPKQRGATQSKTEQTEATESRADYIHNHKQEHNQEHMQKQEEERAQPAASVVGFDGTDMADAIAMNRVAQRLVAQYLPGNPNTPLDLDPRVADVAADIAKYGASKVEDALKTAKESDNRGGASIRFYRAILTDTGQRRQKGGDYQKRAYDERDYKAMEIDLDEL